jgi:hypothetical protein
MSLIFTLRVFLRRLLIWTRAYIRSVYAGVGTPEELFGRLYLETSDFGDLILAFFGRRNANSYTQLLNQFTFGLRDLFTAQQQGNTGAVNENVNRLYQNISDRAAFLASINPYFNENEWKNMLSTYLQYILEEANAYASGDYNKDIELFDNLTALTSKMGDFFAQSLNDYITSGSQNLPKQGTQCLTYEEVNEIFNVRMMWFDLSVWVRNFMLSKYKGLGDVNEVFNRLQEVPAEFINNLKKIFGDNPVLNDYQLQLNEYIGLIDYLTTAQMEGNTDEIQRIVQLLYQNVHDRATSLSSLNPSFWNPNEIGAISTSGVSDMINESTTFLMGDNTRNLDIFSSLLDEAEAIGDYITPGLVNYMNHNPRALVITDNRGSNGNIIK